MKSESSEETADPNNKDVSPCTMLESYNFLEMFISGQ
jgi:hypothetical protein